jgi:hypothetical protein
MRVAIAVNGWDMFDSGNGVISMEQMIGYFSAR